MLDLGLSGLLLAFHHIFAFVGLFLTAAAFTAILQEYRRLILPSPEKLEAEKAKRGYSAQTKRLIRFHVKVLYVGIVMLITGLGAPFVVFAIFVVFALKSSVQVWAEA